MSTTTAPGKSAFADRYGSVFGRQQGLLLKMAGLTASERHAQGPWVEDSQGTRWLDFGSFGLHLLGHRHPTVVQALCEQVAHLGLSTKILANEPIVAAAERLLAVAGMPGGHAVFANSGSEAVEAALKLARIDTGRRRVLAFHHAYHGRTAGALSVSHGYLHHAALMTDGQATFVSPDDEAAVERELATGTFAAVIIEPIQGEGGIRPMGQALLTRLRAACARHGARFILDEIQTGLGRSGELVCPVQPDVRLLGKVLGGGVFPVAVALVDGRRFGAAARDPVVHASSYAASALAGAVPHPVPHPVAPNGLLPRRPPLRAPGVGPWGAGGRGGAGAKGGCETGTQDGFLPRIRTLGARCKEHIAARLGGHPAIQAVRGEGLMLGIEMRSRSLAGELVLEAAKRHLLLAFCLTTPEVVRLYPPATITDADLDDGIDRFCASVQALPLHLTETAHHA